MIRYMVIATEKDGYQWLVDYVIAPSADAACKRVRDTESSLFSAKLHALVA